jgi:hypothetical protein
LAAHFEGDTLAEFRTGSRHALAFHLIYFSIHLPIEEADLRRGRLAHAHSLPHPYRGTNSLLFNGSFYFHRAGTPFLGKFELSTKRYQQMEIGGKQNAADGIAHGGDNVPSCNYLI